MPKPLIAGLVTASLALTISGCAAEDANTDERPRVLTTFTVLQDLAQNIAGDEIVVTSITKVGAEIHGYEPTPSDVANASEADLILANGLGLESWFEQFSAHADAPTAVLSDGIEPLDIAVGEYTGKPNPHAWMSPIAARTYVANTVSALSILLPESAHVFERNANQYIRELEQIESEITTAVDALASEHRLLVTCEGAFSYLARDVGLDEAFLWAVNQDDQGTPQQIASVVETVVERDVPAVFCESTVSDRAQKQVAVDTGANFGGTLYVDSLSVGDPVPTYLDLLRHDVDVIVAGLGAAQ
ncbi:metal ABC transporter substrate-binding protein [Paramicrobacterium chengjingii]|uniref:metal ABC transporter substrate-binding protein n=1 Tax=Paramicrobacterium chengjingii TaxID=2769067 RepID=UPI0014224317|nr:metal ABC transporter substrate-binding protein [Microbacterium chengjingii]